jgi:hypothetical protein
MCLGAQHVHMVLTKTAYQETHAGEECLDAWQQTIKGMHACKAHICMAQHPCNAAGQQQQVLAIPCLTKQHNVVMEL